METVSLNNFEGVEYRLCKTSEIYPVYDHYKVIINDKDNISLEFNYVNNDFIYKLTQIRVSYNIPRMLYGILRDMSPPQVSLRIAGRVPSPLLVDILS